jgi:hypothetical protein
VKVNLHSFVSSLGRALIIASFSSFLRAYYRNQMSKPAYRPPIIYCNVSELHIFLSDNLYNNSIGKVSITYCVPIGHSASITHCLHTNQPSGITHCLCTNQPASITHCLHNNQPAGITHCLRTNQPASITYCRPIDRPETITSNPTSFSITN